MRKIGIILILLLMRFASVAQPPAAMPRWSSYCDSVQQMLELPKHYCACKEEAITFAFPLEEELTDTVWYTATVSDLKQGLSAYWFANTSVTMEVFAFCTSKVPTISLTVGANQMRDVSIEEINQKLNEMGDMAQLGDELTPHMRVYPNKGGSGHVYCYPYDQGPESKCDNPLPLRSGMTYVCDKPENVYRMESTSIVSTGKAFIHWKQKKNLPCEIWLTLDSCTGEEIGRAVLSDSLHVYQPDSAQLVNARKEKRSLWLHAKHAEGVTGRIYYYNNPKETEPLNGTTKKTCLGKTLTVNMRSYTADTSFIDTLWVTRDTLTTMAVKLSFTQPEMEYDTLLLTAVQLNTGYRYASGDIFHEEGDYIVEIKKNNTCTRRIQVTVQEKPTGQATEQTSDKPHKAFKRLQNGQIVLIINGRTYNVLGQQME